MPGQMPVMTPQFIVFLGVGTVCAVIDMGLMQLLILAGFHYVKAATAGFVAGLVGNFLLHTRVTFNSCYSHAVLVKFMVVVAVNYLLTILLVTLAFEWLGAALLGKVISLPLIAVNGFLLSKYWIYR